MSERNVETGEKSPSKEKAQSRIGTKGQPAQGAQKSKGCLIL